MRHVDALFVVCGFGLFGCASAAGDPDAEASELEAGLSGGKLAYQQIDISAGPEGYDFFGATGLSDRGEVFGLAPRCTEVTCDFDLFKLDRELEFSLVAPGFLPAEVNGQGDVGGCVITDLELFTTQAAIVHANGSIEVLPALPGEVSSCIQQLSDNETAVVSSFDAGYVETLYVVRNGHTFPFTVEGAQIRDVNDQGVVAGIVSTVDGDRAFRFDARAQTTEILAPVPPDPNSWGLALNRRSEVLGYSFIFSETERIGKWNRDGEFETYFVEGTPEFPTVSNELIWNEAGLIVVSLTTDANTYLIPKPGVRVNLQDLVVDGAVVPPALVAFDINERGDFVAASLEDGSTQLYRRTRP